MFIYTILPLLIAALIIACDRGANTRLRRLEMFIIFLFSVGVAGNGIGGAFGHLFLSDIVADSIGWPSGNPFQLEVGFANLAIGVMGIIATGRRDGFREATVIAATIFSVGATIVHVIDIVETGNLAPGNTLQNAINLLKPAMLIYFLVALRRAERDPGSEVGTMAFERWRAPYTSAAGAVTGIVASGFGLGFAIDRPVLVTAVSVIVAAVVAMVILKRGPAGARGQG